MAARRLVAWMVGCTVAGTITSTLGAQSGISRPSEDSVLRAEGIRGSVRVALDLSAARPDPGEFRSYALGAVAAPFVSEHLQLGIVPQYLAGDGSRAGLVQFYRLGLLANYVLGAGARWRGFVGGYGESDGGTGNAGATTVGAQAGVLFFLDRAAALRGQITFRRYLPSAASHYITAAVTLDPYVLGRADAIAPAPARPGVFDADVVLSYTALPAYGEWGVRGMLAPYLARWAQVGLAGELDQIDHGAVRHGVRGFGRLYLPLSPRAQPFLEGFATNGNAFAAGGGMVSSYGGMAGLRYMLNARVGLDAGLRRTLIPPWTYHDRDLALQNHMPGVTSLVAGLVTRFSAAR